jgi:Predicted rRNA methylase
MLATLIKPQFELGPGETVKGVVRDEAARQRAVDKILLFTQANLGLACQGVLPAAIKGPKGNQEYMDAPKNWAAATAMPRARASTARVNRSRVPVRAT